MTNYVLVGCGKMGGALLSGWIERGVPRQSIKVVEPAAAAARAIGDHYAIEAVSEASQLPDGLAPDVVIFAVKPQVMADVVPAYRRFVPKALFASIAAGKPIGFFEFHLGAEAAIVRTMPNTPAAVHRGITVACANGCVTAGQRAMCQSLLEAVGEVAWVEDEALLDPVTAVSGSGPAYVFLMIECLTEAGVKSGLPPELAARLARATVAGSGELARQSTEAPATLRKNVTSPGGTTEAALKVLMAGDGLQALLDRAVDAATRRSRELAG
ncbi:MAG: pyrroline-5-carboxylate reductase [Rhodospirillales bacterium]